MKTVRRLSRQDIARELKTLEKRHGMTTSEFVDTYKRGKAGHDPDFVRWVGLARMAAAASGATGRVKSR